MTDLPTFGCPTSAIDVIKGNPVGLNPVILSKSACPDGFFLNDKPRQYEQSGFPDGYQAKSRYRPPAFPVAFAVLAVALWVNKTLTVP